MPENRFDNQVSFDGAVARSSAEFCTRDLLDAVRLIAILYDFAS
jgi:hypothetical protein